MTALNESFCMRVSRCLCIVSKHRTCYYSTYKVLNLRANYIIYKNSSHQSFRHWKQSADCLELAEQVSFIHS